MDPKQLIEGLGGEKARWLESADRLGVKYINLTGDVLVSAGVMAYLGPFTATFRNGQLGDWVALCKDKSIPCSTSPTLSGRGTDWVHLYFVGRRGLVPFLSIEYVGMIERQPRRV